MRPLIQFIIRRRQSVPTPWTPVVGVRSGAHVPDSTDLGGSGRQKVGVEQMVRGGGSELTIAALLVGSAARVALCRGTEARKRWPWRL